MADPETTQPNLNTGQKLEAASKSLWVWSETHTIIAVPTVTFVLGWLLGKLL